jgi:hypothetical protein
VQKRKAASNQAAFPIEPLLPYSFVCVANGENPRWRVATAIFVMHHSQLAGHMGLRSMSSNTPHLPSVNLVLEGNRVTTYVTTVWFWRIATVTPTQTTVSRVTVALIVIHHVRKLKVENICVFFWIPIPVDGISLVDCYFPQASAVTIVLTVEPMHDRSDPYWAWTAIPDGNDVLIRNCDHVLVVPTAHLEPL